MTFLSPNEAAGAGIAPLYVAHVVARTRRQPDEYYVFGRPPGHDRIGLYRCDLTREAFGEPNIERPTYDLSPRTWRATGLA